MTLQLVEIIIYPSRRGPCLTTSRLFLSAILHTLSGRPLKEWRSPVAPDLDACCIGCAGPGAAIWLVSVPGSTALPSYFCARPARGRICTCPERAIGGTASRYFRPWHGDCGFQGGVLPLCWVSLRLRSCGGRLQLRRQWSPRPCGHYGVRICNCNSDPRGEKVPPAPPLPRRTDLTVASSSFSSSSPSAAPVHNACTLLPDRCSRACLTSWHLRMHAHSHAYGSSDSDGQQAPV